MNFGLDIFPEAVVEFYDMWKWGVGGTRIGDDINEKRKPDLASRKKCMILLCKYIYARDGQKHYRRSREKTPLH